MILLYPGSFNPVHNGHLRLAEYALVQTQAEELWFIVSPNNPLKAPHELWDEQLRFDLLQAAIQGKENMRVSDIEFTLPRPSYTANTLRALSESYPDKQFALLIGEDNMQVFDKWREHDWILAHYPIFVYPRAPQPPKGEAQDTAGNMSASEDMKRNTPFRGIGGFHMLKDAPLCPISSTQIRERLTQIKESNTTVDVAFDAILRWLPDAIVPRLL